MSTAADRFTALSGEVQEAVKDFFATCCIITYAPINTPDSPIVFITGQGDYEVSLNGSDAVNKLASLISKFDRMKAMAEWLIVDSDPRMQISDIRERIKELVRVHHQDLSKAADHYCGVIRGWTLLKSLSLDDWYREEIFVPDTNALLHNPDLEKWQFDGHKRFTVLLLPTVMQELDSIGNRTTELGKQAGSVITRIKGWRGRGKLAEGVPILKEKILLRSSASEPDFSHLPSWLDATRNDDRILGIMFNLMQKHPRTEITLVTRDINLQNKAEHYEVQFVDPPEKVLG
jgi:hypothetical protein